jgi:protocatechuate 3,4-dioxygenase beta subunit
VRLPTPILRGRVIDATGRPTRGAWIQLESLHGIGGRTATADAAGRYEIYGVQPGDYRLTVRHMGLPVQYGQRRPGETGTIITLRTGDMLEGLDVRLPSAGTIAGRVVDAYGDALEGITVQAWARSVRDGRAALAPVPQAPTGRTDDRGAYRIFGLPPGTYYVVAGDAPSPAERTAALVSRTVTSGGDMSAVLSIVAEIESEVGSLVYHPATIRVADAVPVFLDVGTLQSGVEITFAPPPLASVGGVVTGESGRPVDGSASLVLSARPGVPAPPSRSTIVNGDGAFVFRDVPPGEYVLRVSTSGEPDPSAAIDPFILPEIAAAMPVPRRNREFAARLVTVSGPEDVHVPVGTSRGTLVTGRFVIEGDRAGVEPAASRWARRPPIPI